VSAGTLLLTVLRRGGAPAPEIVVAPSALPSPPVIGTAMAYTAGTWSSGTPTFTRWEKSATGVGSWSTAAATMPNATSAPTDTEFGLYLRPVETNDGVEAAGASVGPVAEAPVQSLGAELLTNGDFSAWTTDNPNGWTVTGESGSDPMVTQVAADGSAGTGAARLFASTATTNPTLTQTVMIIGNYYELASTVSARTSGTIRVRESFNQIHSYAAAGSQRSINRATATGLTIDAVSGAHDAVLDTASVKALTLNTQLTAPSADMRLDFFYTLPVTPIQGDQVWLLPRISNFASGNYFLVLLQYTGSQWNINLYTVASHTRTSIAAATNIGTTNGLRFAGSGDQVSMWTTANGGTNWTQRDTTKTNTTYQTATGVNTAHTSSVTPGQLVFANP
jgi:hypothetical protein